MNFRALYAFCSVKNRFCNIASCASPRKVQLLLYLLPEEQCGTGE
jgi:hypothetical protein